MLVSTIKRAAVLATFLGFGATLPAMAQNIPNAVLNTVYESMPLSEQCENPSFESGFSTWQRFKGRVNRGFATSLGAPTVVPSTICIENGGNQACSIIQTGGFDGYQSTLPRTAVGDAIRLGGNHIEISNRPSSNGNVADGIGKRFIVQPGNELYRFRYAAVLERAHDASSNYTGDEPYFQAIAIDPADGSVIDTVLQPASGFNFNVVPSDLSAAHRYIPWSCAQLDLTGYTGQEVVVYFIAGDCNHGGHGSYAYVDDTCSDCEVPEEPTADVTLDPVPAQCTKPDQDVSVTGEFNISDEYFDLYGATNVNVSLDVVQSNSTVHTISSGTMTGSTYSFDLDSSVLPQEECFDLVVTLTFDTVTPTGLIKTVTIVTALDGRVEGQDNDLCTGGDTCLPNCAPFTQEEAICNTTTGAYEISIANSLSGSFDPNDISVTTTTPGVTITQNPFDRLTLLVTGATPGQVIPISTSAIAEGAGAGTGLDLCCNGEMEITIPVGELCEIIVDPNAPVDVSIEKTWHDVIDSQVDVGQFPHGFEVLVNLETGQLQPGDVVTVSDPLAGQVGITSFGAPLAPAPWVCSETGGAWNCTYVVPSTGAALPVTIIWPSAIDSSVYSKNCANVDIVRANMSVAETTMANNTSCWAINEPSDDNGGGGNTDPVEVNIFKECEPIVETIGPVSNELTMDCRIKVQPLTAATGNIVISDIATNLSGGGQGSFNSAPTVDPSVWTCAPSSGATQDCTADGNTYPVDGFGNPMETTIDVTLTMESTGGVVTWENCAEGVFESNNNAPDQTLIGYCVQETFTPACIAVPEIPGDGIDNDCDGETDETTPMRQGTVTSPELVLTKSPLGTCSVNAQSQTYSCDFALIVENTGSNPFTGPLHILDVFGSPAPRNVGDVTADGWECLTSSGVDQASCLAPDMGLDAGESTSVEMSLTLPGNANGGSFENCASFALPESLVQQAKIIQTLLIDIGIDVGAVDGVVGPNTRAGIAQLQRQENWPETGDVSVGLLQAIGLNIMAQDPSCVTVTLPPMPAPPLSCDPSTTVLIDGACECRFSRMLQTNASSCSCIQGTQFDGARGCVRPQRQISEPSRPSSTPSIPNCPPGSTYSAARGGCIAPATPPPPSCTGDREILVNGRCLCERGYVLRSGSCRKESGGSGGGGIP